MEHGGRRPSPEWKRKCTTWPPAGGWETDCQAQEARAPKHPLSPRYGIDPAPLLLPSFLPFKPVQPLLCFTHTGNQISPAHKGV